MKKIVAISLMIPLCWNAAALACSRDYTGTVPTEQGRGLPDSAWCFNCRELNGFPQDFTNNAWNYVQHGDGAFTFGLYHEGLDRSGASSTMPVRSCNAHGQCATTMVTVNFNTIDIGISVFSISIRTSINNYRLVTTLPNGQTHEVTHFPQTVSQDPLPVPTDSQDDGVDDDTCLDNDGEENIVVPVPGPGGGGGEGIEPYDPTLPDFGWGGGGPSLYQECWRIVTRDSEGNVIGDTVQCVITPF